MAAGPWFEAPLRRVVDGRRVVLVGGVPQMWPATVEVVRRHGATEVLVIATEGQGIGDPPDCPTLVVERPDGLSLLDRIRRGAEVQRNPPALIVDGLAAFDPDETALLLGTFLNETPQLAGRPFLNHRLPAWVALEDKTVIDDVWDRCGVRRAPSAVVPMASALEAASRLDRGHGTVWAGDASEGWHGGAELTRWVVDDDHARAATAELGQHCRRVRVMPFLEGIPCSIHGIVLPDGVIALRPVEMVTLRRGTGFFYAGCATYWDPPPEVRDEMRAVASRVGDRLASAVGFRGPFTVDGVATVDGFLPTELNPRAGAGLHTMSRGLPDGFPLLLLLDLVGGGIDLGRGASALEEELLESADHHRSGGTWRFGDVDPAAYAGPLWYTGEQWSSVEPTEPPPSATVQVDSGAARCLFDAATWPVGPSVGPAAVAFYAWCDQVQGATIGSLTAAPDVLAV